tara:strand:+ start:179 stop:544 length:366 start_codon:yes stop_codon:yes gene_type:complete
MAGSLGLGIGFEEHHVENIYVGPSNNWDADVCTEGTFDPDCGCCCQLSPPDQTGLATDPDWTLAWGVDSNGNLVPEDAVYAASDGFWTYDAASNALIPVSVLFCNTIVATGMISTCTPEDC